MPELLDMSAPALAILGDYVPFGIGQASASWPAATASTTRCGSPGSCPPSGCCVDIRVHAVHNGFGHGLVHLWAEDGTLLATASQSHASSGYWKPRSASALIRQAQLEEESTTDDASRCAGA